MLGKPLNNGKINHFWISHLFYFIEPLFKIKNSLIGPMDRVIEWTWHSLILALFTTTNQSRVWAIKSYFYFLGWCQGVKVGKLGRQNVRNSRYFRLAHTSIFGLCFMSVCLMKPNCYSLIYYSLLYSHKWMTNCLTKWTERKLILLFPLSAYPW